MALEGPSFFSFIRLVLSATTTSITIGLVLYQRRLLLHEVIGPGIMVCVTFDHRDFYPEPTFTLEKVATFCIFKKSRLLLKIADFYPKSLDFYQKVSGHREPASIRAFFFFLGHLCFFACGEGRRRVCGLPQSLWRQLKNHHHHHQGFLSGARVQFHLPTGVESSIHRYVSKSLPFIGMYLNPSIHRRSGLKTSWRVMCRHQHNLLHLLIHLLLHTPVVNF
jgi:hypothetical protein